jgi:hypothetical protein
MQTEHYMANMDKPRDVEPLGVVDLEPREVGTALDVATCSAQSLDDDARPA